MVSCAPHWGLTDAKGSPGTSITQSCARRAKKACVKKSGLSSPLEVRHCQSHTPWPCPSKLFTIWSSSDPLLQDEFQFNFDSALFFLWITALAYTWSVIFSNLSGTIPVHILMYLTRTRLYLFFKRIFCSLSLPLNACLGLEQVGL